jgi:RNA polymerase sigma-70 factor (ECF subfamily)
VGTAFPALNPLRERRTPTHGRDAGERRPNPMPAPPDTDSVAPSDAELLSRIGARDREAFEALFARYAGRIKGFMMRSGASPQDADEIAQDVMVAVWRGARGFDPARAGAATWIFAIARNRRIDLIRRSRRPAPDPADPLFRPDPEPDGLDALSQAEQEARLRESLAVLPPSSARCWSRPFNDGLSHGEIAVAQGPSARDGEVAHPDGLASARQCSRRFGEGVGTWSDAVPMVGAFGGGDSRRKPPPRAPPWFATLSGAVLAAWGTGRGDLPALRLQDASGACRSRRAASSSAPSASRSPAPPNQGASSTSRAWRGGWPISGCRSGPALRSSGPAGPAERGRLREGFTPPGQIHTNSRAKHAGFLALAQRLGGAPEYDDPGPSGPSRGTRGRRGDVRARRSGGFASTAARPRSSP